MVYNELVMNCTRSEDKFFAKEEIEHIDHILKEVAVVITSNGRLNWGYSVN
jgi:hypothetical protein